eukprot:g4556.t1
MAEQIHREILEKYPAYSDSLCRIGCIYRKSGQYDAAKKEFENAEKIAVKSSHLDSGSLNLLLKRTDPTILRANMEYKQRHFKEAQEAYEKVLPKKAENEKGKKSEDSYAQLAMGNLYHMRADPEGEDFNRCMIYARRFYGSVSAKEPANIFAANGLAMILGELCQLDKAIHVFERLRETAPGVPSVWINLANAYVLNGRPESAVQLYRSCREDFCEVGSVQSHDRRVRKRAHLPTSSKLTGAYLRMLEANAQFVCNPPNFKAASDLLSLALQDSPSDRRMWRALAKVSQAWGESILDTKNNLKRTVEHVDRAARCLETAKKMFILLEESETNPKRKEKFTEKVKRNSSNLKNIPKFREYAKTLEERKEHTKKLFEERRAKREADVREYEKKKRNENESHINNLYEKRLKRDNEELMRMQEAWTQRGGPTQDEEKEEAMKAAKAVFAEDDDEDSDDDSDDDGKGGKNKNEVGGANGGDAAAAFDSDDEDSDDEDGKTSNVSGKNGGVAVFDEDSDDEDSDAGKLSKGVATEDDRKRAAESKTEEAGARPTKRQRRVLDDSSSDEEGG